MLLKVNKHLRMCLMALLDGHHIILEYFFDPLKTKKKHTNIQQENFYNIVVSAIGESNQSLYKCVCVRFCVNV